MDAEFSVELGSDDPTLAIPWKSPDGSVEYVDLAAHPEHIDELMEVTRFSELSPVLLALNGPASPFRTAKCDAWFDTLMDVDDEPYEATIKCASYIDVLFARNRKLAGFGDHEAAAREVVRRLRALPDGNARVEITIRRCYHLETSTAEEGLYWTVYAFGYGRQEQEARAAWNRALVNIQNALAHLDTSTD